jgi:hypothetical protein
MNKLWVEDRVQKVVGGGNALLDLFYEKEIELWVESLRGHKTILRMP